MATSITHTVLAKKLYDKLHLTIDENEFMVGNIFPDIRYLGGISREKTHIENPDFNKIQNKNAFSAGVLAHSLVDKLVNDFAKLYIYPFCNNNEFRAISVKLLEDELLYAKIADWNKYDSAFDKIYPGELEFDISPDAIKKYHQIAKNYFSQKPNELSRKEMFSECGFSDEKIIKINTLISKLRENPKIIESINKLYDNFKVEVKNKK